MKFMKWHGAGNDFILIESETITPKQAEELAIQVCDRHFGVGADGLMIVSQSADADVKMQYYNSDGSYGAMCGNGIRCFSAFCKYRGLVSRETFTVETGDGTKTVTVKIDPEYQVRVDMGTVQLSPGSIPVGEADSTPFNQVEILGKVFSFYALKVGVPHIVIEGAYTLEEVLQYGPLLEKHELFPENTNVNFMSLQEDDSILVTTWERGAGLTLACGTGACASAYVAHKHYSKTQPIKAVVPGGVLTVEVHGDHLIMWGPAKPIAEGELHLPL